MFNTPGILSFSLVLISVFLFSISIYVAVKKRHVNSWLPFSLLLAATAVYAGGYAGEILQTTKEGALFWLNVEYFGIPFIPVTWVLFAHTHSDVRFKKKFFYIGLIAEAIITFIAEHTNNYHGLYYSSIEMIRHGSITVGNFSHGPLYWFHIIVQQTAMFTGTFFIIMHLRNAQKLYKIQMFFLTAGACVPVFGNIVYLAGLSPHNIDISPFTLALTVAMCYTGIFAFNVLDILPISRVYFFDALNDPAIVYDNKNRLIDFNKAAVKLFPFLSHKSIGLYISDLFIGHDDIVRILADSSGSKDFFREKNGAQRSFELMVSPLNIEKNYKGSAVIFSDITERINLLSEIQRLAETDPLTGALNRRSFMELAESERLRSSRTQDPFSIILLDLDNFKNINDTFGHAAGDEVLKTSVSVFKKSLRSTDFFARYGGEEFAILLPGTSGNEAKIVAEKIRKNIESAEILFSGNTIRFTSSIGVTNCIASRRTTFDSLMRLADKAMYCAKSNGKNCVEIENGTE